MRRRNPMSQWGEAILPLLSLVLLGVGLFCMLTQRRVIKQVVGLNIMLQGALVSVIDGGRARGEMRLAQSVVVSALVVEAMVFAIVLALVVNVYRYHPEGMVDDLDTLKG
jgi:NADH:ubiquinone oxidoreductase subunit K